MALTIVFNQAGPNPGQGAAIQSPQFVAASGAVQPTPVSRTVPQTQGARTYGRVGQKNGMGGTWVVVTPDANGFQDLMNCTTLAQTLKLNLNESPFWANYGIPAQQTVITQIFPDYYVAQTQSQFAPKFASLAINRLAAPDPTYAVNVVSHSNAILGNVIPT